MNGLAIFGNHSPTVPDYSILILSKTAVDVISDEQWLQGEYIPAVAKRCSHHQGKRSFCAASAANALINHVQSLYTVSDKIH